MSKAVENEQAAAALPMSPALTGLIMNSMTTRAQLMTAILDPRRDINKECGYPDVIDPAQYRLMYDREGIAKRVVNIMPEESWAVDPEVTDDQGSADETEFDKTLKTLVQEQHLWHYLERVDKLSGIGHFGVLLIGLDDGKHLHEPVDGFMDPAATGETITSAPQQLPAQTVPDTPRDLNVIYLRAFDESFVDVSRYDTNINSPRYNLPVIYRLRFADNKHNHTGAPQNETTLDVHWSRVIHIADNREVGEVFGVPRMRDVYNRLHDIRKIMAGSGEMFWKGGFPGYAFTVDPDLDAELDKTGLRQEFDNYQNGLQRYLALEGVQATSLEVQVADPSTHFKAHMQYCAISKGIPWRIFAGSEEAKLAGAQDDKSWNKRIMRRNDKYLTPLVVRATIDRLIQYGAVAAPKTEDGYDVTWPDLNALGDAEKAEIAAKQTDALSKYVAGQVHALIEPEDYLTTILGFDKDEVQTMLEHIKDGMIALSGGDIDPLEFLMAHMGFDEATARGIMDNAPTPGQPAEGEDEGAAPEGEPEGDDDEDATT